MKLVLNKQEAFFKTSLVNKIIPLPVAEEHSAQHSGGCWHTPVPAWGVIWAGFWRCRGAGAPKQAPVAPVSLRLVFSAPLGPPQLGSSCQPWSLFCLVAVSPRAAARMQIGTWALQRALTSQSHQSVTGCAVSRLLASPANQGWVFPSLISILDS